MIHCRDMCWSSRVSCCRCRNPLDQNSPCSHRYRNNFPFHQESSRASPCNSCTACPILGHSGRVEIRSGRRDKRSCRAVTVWMRRYALCPCGYSLDQFRSSMDPHNCTPKPNRYLPQGSSAVQMKRQLTMKGVVGLCCQQW